MSGILVEVYEQGGTLLETHPVLDSYVVEVPVAQTVGVIEVGILGPQGPAGPEGPAGPGGGGDVYKAADQTFTGVNTFTGISVLQGPISPVVATDVAVRVRGLVGQSIDLQRWEDYGGTVLASINRFGEGLFNTQQGSGGVVVGRGNGAGFAGIRAGSDTGVLEIQGPQSGSTGALRLGNQTGGVTIFGPVLLDDQSGMHTTDSFVFYDGTYGTKAVLSPLHGFALGNLPTSTAPVLAVTAWAPSYPGVVVQGAVGQSAALQQWQNNGGTALASVNNAGELSTPAVYINEGGNGGVQWRRVSGVPSWQWYSPDDPNLYLRDLVNARMSIQASPGLTVLSTPVMVSTGVASELPFVVRGSSGQSADLTQWQDYTGGVLAKVGADGRIQATNELAVIGSSAQVRFADRGGPTYYDGIMYKVTGVLRWYMSGDKMTLTEAGDLAAVGKITASDRLEAHEVRVQTLGNAQLISGGNGAMLAVESAAPAYLGIIVRGATSQLQDLTVWQAQDGTQLAKVTKDGYIYEGANRVYSAGNPPPGGGGSPFVAASDASTPLIARGFSATQSGDLQEWQGSDGSVLARVEADGTFRLRYSSAIIGPAATTWMNAALNVVPYLASEVGVVVRGYTGQSADLQSWQDSTPTPVAKVTAVGDFFTNAQGLIGSRYFADYANTKAYWDTAITNVGWQLGNRNNTSQVPIVIQGSAGQTADLQQWNVNGGSPIARINPGGGLTVTNVSTPYVQDTAQTGVYLATSAAGGSMQVQGRTTTDTPLKVQGAASHSGNLQEWNINGGSALAVITVTGAIYGSALYDNGSRVAIDSAVVHVTGTEVITGSKIFRSVLSVNGGASTGQIAVQPGDSTHSGYIEITAANGTRQGYIGYTSSTSAQDTGQINYVAGLHTFTGALGTSGNITENGNRVYSAGNAPPYPVTSVATRTGAVTLTAADVGVGTFPAGNYLFAGASTLQIANNTGLADSFKISNLIDQDLIIRITGSGAADKYALIAPSTSTRLAFGTALTERMSIDNTGKLTVSGAISAGGKVTVTSTTADQVTVLSGASGTATAVAIGRTAVESRYAVSSASADYFTDSAAGDLNFRLADTTKTIHIGLGTGTSASMIRVISTGVTVAGTFNATGAVTQNGSQVALDSAAVHVTGSESIGGIKTFTSIPVVPVLSWPVGSINATGTAGAGNYLRGDGTWSIPVTSVTGSTFISFTASTGSVTASLSATGTPGATNVLRGDNTWAAVPMSSQYTAKGTILVGSAASTPSAQAVGTDGQVLVARSAQTNGVGWENTNFAATGLGSTGNTVTETVIASFTIPAAYLLAGTVLRLACLGQASSTQTLTFKVHCGINGTTADALLQTFTTSAAGVANQHAMLDAFVHCLTAGSGGTIYAGGIATYGTAVLPPVTAAAISAAVDTTVQNKITVTMTNGSAGTSFTSRTATLNRVA